MGEQFQLKHNKYCTNLWCKYNIILAKFSYDDNNSFVSCCPLTIPLMVRPPWWILCWCWWRCSWYVPQTTIKSYATDINNSNRGAGPLFLGLAQNGSRRGYLLKRRTNLITWKNLMKMNRDVHSTCNSSRTWLIEGGYLVPSQQKCFSCDEVMQTDDENVCHSNAPFLLKFQSSPRVPDLDNTAPCIPVAITALNVLKFRGSWEGHTHRMGLILFFFSAAKFGLLVIAKKVTNDQV